MTLTLFKGALINDDVKTTFGICPPSAVRSRFPINTRILGRVPLYNSLWEKHNTTITDLQYKKVNTFLISHYTY